MRRVPPSALHGYNVRGIPDIDHITYLDDHTSNFWRVSPFNPPVILPRNTFEMRLSPGGAIAIKVAYALRPKKHAT